MERQDSILHDDIMLIGKPREREEGDGMESDQDNEYMSALVLDTSDSFEVESEQDIVLDMSSPVGDVQTDEMTLSGQNQSLETSESSEVESEQTKEHSEIHPDETTPISGTEKVDKTENDDIIEIDNQFKEFETEITEITNVSISDFDSIAVLSEQIERMEALVAAYTEGRDSDVHECIKDAVAEITESNEEAAENSEAVACNISGSREVVSCTEVDFAELDIQLEQDAVSIIEEISMAEEKKDDEGKPKCNKNEEIITPTSMEVALYSPYIPPISSRSEQLVPLVPLAWVPMGSVLPTPRASPSFAVLRPGTPSAGSSSSELLLGNPHYVCV